MSSSHHNTVQELAENGHLQEIPGDFIIPEEERCNLKDGSSLLTMESALELPLIDMDEAAETQLAAGGNCHGKIVHQIRTACEEWGFFQVKNHGIPLSVIKEMQQVVHEFLELPVEEKNKVMSNSVDRQAQGYSTRQALNGGALSLWSDRLHYHMSPMSIRNYDLWPKNPSRFR
jgi:leucoanthocyanidin dioxygenase